MAFNNHYGHRGWEVWIISLKDGSVVRNGGKVTSGNYDRYQDYDYLPNVAVLAKQQLTAIYPNYPTDTDRRGEGHITVVYGWDNDRMLKMFDEIVLDDLFAKESRRFSVYSLLTVGEAGLSA